MTTGLAVPEQADGDVLDLRPSQRGLEMEARMLAFMNEQVLPAEETYRQQRAEAGRESHDLPPVVEMLKSEARRLGLWNLFLPEVSGLTNLDYAGVAELSGWSQNLAPEAINGQAPDTGNMELLQRFGTAEQQAQWLEPLLDGRIRSAFAMTEPEVASSDATNVRTRIHADGSEVVVDGHKWWTSGAADPRCAVLVVMGVSQPEAPPHRRQSMVLVPRDTPGVRVVRDVPVFGRYDQHGHCEVVFDSVRVPSSHVLGELGDGFAIAQARLGPGRLHHCMRAVGASERALAMMVHRAQVRTAFGGPLSERGLVQASIARSRIEIDQARLVTRRAARAIDLHGNRAASTAVSIAKVTCAQVGQDVVDRAIQVFGGAGISDDFPLAEMFGWHRSMRIFDGPDEVHLRSIARNELRRSPADA